jgi:hypothetical protein
MPQIHQKEVIDMLPEIKCNVCYQPMTLVPYDCGFFIEPCKHCTKDHEDKLKESFDEGYNDGYDDGYMAGKEEVREEIENFICGM